MKHGLGTPATFPERVRLAATNVGETVMPHIEQTLAVVEMVNLQLAASNKQIMKEAKDDVICRRLMTVPGVGPITAVGFVAAIDDETRFAHAYRVQSYLGLTPGEDSSS